MNDAFAGQKSGWSSAAWVLVLVCLLPFPLNAADGLSTWTRLSPESALSGVAASRDRVVAVGRQGTILSSGDGREWRRERGEVTVGLTDVTYADGWFTAVGEEGHVGRSADGQTWSWERVGLTNRYYGVAEREGALVVCGDQGTLRHRDASGQWEVRPTTTQETLTGVACSSSVTVAVGMAGTILRSTDHRVFQQVATSNKRPLVGLRWLKDQFIALGFDGTMLASRDGLEWSPLRGESIWTFRDAALIDDRPVVVGSSGHSLSSYGVVSLLQDGVRWVDQAPPINQFHAVTVYQGALIAVGAGGMVARSVDGIGWEQMLGTPNDVVWRIADTPQGRWVTTIKDPESSDFEIPLLIRGVAGIYRHGGSNSWVALPRNHDPALVRIAESSGRWVGIGDRTNIWGSSDGIQWTRGRGLPASARLWNVVAGHGSFVAVGGQLERGMIVRSDDGLTWEEVAVPNPGALSEIVFGAGRFLAAGDSGDLLGSEDGRKWTVRSTLRGSVTGLAFGNGRFVAASEGNLVFSLDGTRWSPQTNAGFRCQTVAFGGGQFLAAGSAGAMATSVDGSTWRRLSTGLTEDWYELVWNGVRFVAGGRRGGIAESGVVSLLPPLWIQLPRNVGVNSGGGFELEAVAVESVPLTYQWYKDGAPIDGATSARWIVSSAVRSDQGSYWVVASNRLGVVQSPPVLVDVAPLQAVDRWEVVRKPTSDLLLDRAAGGGGRFLAVTVDGDLAVSTNGYQWANAPAISPARLTNVRFLEGQFVVTGEAGYLARSIDGNEWEVAKAFTEATLRSIARGDGLWVAVGDHGTVLASRDFKDWTVEESGLTRRLRSVCWNQDGFTVVGDAGAILYSPDGHWWFEEDSATTADLHAVAAQGSILVAVGSGGEVIRTGSGFWSRVFRPPASLPSIDLLDVIPWEGRFRIVGRGFQASISAGSASGGSSFFGATPEAPMFSNLFASESALYGVAGTALAVLDSRGFWAPMTSSDAGTKTLLAIGEVGEHLVAVGAEGAMLKSRDGLHWDRVATGVPHFLTSVAGWGNVGVVVGSSSARTGEQIQSSAGILLATTNSTDWLVIDGFNTNRLWEVRAGAGRFVAVGDGGTVLMSQDGLSWRRIATGGTESITAVAHDGSQFWVASSRRLMRSASGLTWSSVPISGIIEVEDLLVSGTDRRMVTSGTLRRFQENGTIEPRPGQGQPLSFILSRVVRQGSTFVGVGYTNVVGLSRDGVNWAPMTALQPWRLRDVKVLRSAHYAVGSYGVILRSAPLASLVARPEAEGGLELYLDHAGGRRFRLERSNVLTPEPAWQDLGLGEARGERAYWVDRESSAIGGRFYRAVLDR